MRFAPSALVLAFAVLSPAFGQDQKQSALDAYQDCSETIHRSPEVGFKTCKDYLEKFSSDEEKRANQVRGWVQAYQTATVYAKALQGFPNEPGRDWFVYAADLKVSLPSLNDEKDNYKISIVRSFSNSHQEEMLRKAEAVYRSQDGFIRMITSDPLGWGPDLPNQIVPLWGTRGNDNVRVPEVITA